MSPQDGDFDNLRSLLRCKRYEKPPPGYFLNFSDKVLARIEAEQGAEYSSCWSWIVKRFDARPALVCVFGLAVSGLLLIGVRLSHAADAQMGAIPVSSAPWLAAMPASPFLAQDFAPAIHIRANSAEFSRIQPRSRENTSLFVWPGELDLQPASFTPPAN